MISEKIKAAYRQYRRVKIAALIGLIIDALLITGLAGGFPPWAWRFLAQIVPQLPQLWRVRGLAVLPSLIGLCLLSLSLLILWVVIIYLILKVAFHLWQDYHSRQKLQEELRVAEILAEHDFKTQEEEEQYQQVAPPAPPAPVAPPHSAPVRSPARTLQRLPQRAPMAQPVQANAYTMRKAAGETINAFPGLSYPVPSHLQTDLSRFPTRPATHEPEEAMTSFFPDAARSAQPMRQRLHLVNPIQDIDDDAVTSWQTADEELADFADAQFIGNEEEPGTSDTSAMLDRTELEELDDLGDISAEMVLPLHTPESISRNATLAIWGEQDELEEEPVPAPSAMTADAGSESEVPLRLVVGIGIDPGIARKDAPNEDSLFVIQGMRITDSGSKPAGLFIIADGMGGHVNGREASRSAIRALSDVVVPTLLRDVSGSSAREEETLFVDMLKDGVHRANLSLYQQNRMIEGMMGTTVTSALIVGTTAYVANVGDSRTYLYRRSEGLQQVTRDHSVVARMVENGLITRDDVYTHPKRNQIYRCLGEHASVEMDTFVVPLQADDILLLCSDGLWEMLRDGELERLIAASAHSPSLLCTQLVRAALSSGGADNISVVVVRLAQHPALSSQHVQS